MRAAFFPPCIPRHHLSLSLSLSPLCFLLSALGGVKRSVILIARQKCLSDASTTDHARCRIALYIMPGIDAPITPISPVTSSYVHYAVAIAHAEFQRAASARDISSLIEDFINNFQPNGEPYVVALSLSATSRFPGLSEGARITVSQPFINYCREGVGRGNSCRAFFRRNFSFDVVITFSPRVPYRRPLRSVPPR